jgi:hypothetical protein
MCNFVYAASSEVETEFTVYFEDAFCHVDDQGDTFWIEQVDSEIRFTRSLEDCYRDDVEDFSSNYCCPAGYSCLEGDDTWECGVTGYYLCSDLSQTECGKHQAVAITDVNSKIAPQKCGKWEKINETCYIFVDSCRCEWRNDRCRSAYNLTLDCGDGPRPIGSCLFDLTDETNCTASGRRITEWSAVWSGEESDKPDYCVDGTKEAPCLSDVLLDFFDVISAIAAVIIIIIFYLIVVRKKKKYRTKKKKK